MPPHKTASVEILEGVRSSACDFCTRYFVRAKYNVFDGNTPKYACGKHLTLAISAVATRK